MRVAAGALLLMACVELSAALPKQGSGLPIPFDALEQLPRLVVEASTADNSTGGGSRRLQLPTIQTCDLGAVSTACDPTHPSNLMGPVLCATPCALSVRRSFDSCQRDFTAGSLAIVQQVRQLVTLCEPCASSPCSSHGHHGMCVETDGSNNGAAGAAAGMGYACNCEVGWEGDDCASRVDVCASAPCQRGECTSSNVAVGQVVPYTCSCPVGYMGGQCEELICASSPCTHGTCAPNAQGGYDCDCADGFQGSHCESRIDYCQAMPCQNQGTCRGHVGSFECECRQGFYGDRCESS